MSHATPGPLLGLGAIRPDGAHSYRTVAPLPASVVPTLLRQPWCRSVEVHDGSGHTEFRAFCEINGRAVTVTGRIAGER